MPEILLPRDFELPPALQEGRLADHAQKVGLLAVGEGHELLYVVWGADPSQADQSVTDVIYFAGGPASPINATHTLAFDPSIHRVAYLWHRGTSPNIMPGRSGLAANTMGRMIDDHALLAAHVGMKRYFVAGGSSGAGAALMHGGKYAEQVLGGMFWSVYLHSHELQNAILHAGEEPRMKPHLDRLLSHIPSDLHGDYGRMASYAYGKLKDLDSSNERPTPEQKELLAAYAVFHMAAARPIDSVDEETRKLYEIIDLVESNSDAFSSEGIFDLYVATQHEKGVKDPETDLIRQVLVPLHYFAHHGFVDQAFHPLLVARSYQGKLVLIASGIHDLNTPYHVAEKTFNIYAAAGAAVRLAVTRAGHDRTDSGLLAVNQQHARMLADFERDRSGLLLPAGIRRPKVLLPR